MLPCGGRVPVAPTRRHLRRTQRGRSPPRRGGTSRRTTASLSGQPFTSSQGEGVAGSRDPGVATLLDTGEADPGAGASQVELVPSKVELVPSKPKFRYLP